MPQRIEPTFYLFGHYLLLSLLLSVFRQLISVLLQRLHSAHGFLKALLNSGCLVDLLLPILLEYALAEVVAHRLGPGPAHRRDLIIKGQPTPTG